MWLLSRSAECPDLGYWSHGWGADLALDRIDGRLAFPMLFVRILQIRIRNPSSPSIFDEERTIVGFRLREEL
jgi:hypothetical protein